MRFIDGKHERKPSIWMRMENTADWNEESRRFSWNRNKEDSIIASTEDVEQSLAGVDVSRRPRQISNDGHLDVSVVKSLFVNLQKISAKQTRRY